MPAERLPMRKVREVLRQRYAFGASERVIAQSLGLGRTAVGEYIRRAAVIGVTWPIPAELDDPALERKLFAPAGYNPPRSKPLPDWAHIHAELRRARVTLALLWQDYRGQHPEGYGYSRFCDLYGEWRRGVTATMRQTHIAGEKLFVDFAGDTMPVFDAVTGEVRDTKIFVAVLGASNYTYVEARFSEGLPDWIGAHVNALEFLGGVPKAIVCDNLKAGVTTASRYEPGVNRTYQDLAAHYGTTIMPTRPRKPRDKAKVEGAVLIVERWILARLRDRRFFSLAELNVAIRTLVDELNGRLMRKLGASRREFFETIDRPALMPLPGEPYQYAEWRRARVAPDYHVEVHGHFYSVPSRLIRQVVSPSFLSEDRPISFAEFPIEAGIVRNHDDGVGDKRIYSIRVDSLTADHIVSHFFSKLDGLRGDRDRRLLERTESIENSDESAVCQVAKLHHPEFDDFILPAVQAGGLDVQ
jgi:transposase